MEGAASDIGDVIKYMDSAGRQQHEEHFMRKLFADLDGYQIEGQEMSVLQTGAPAIPYEVVFKVYIGPKSPYIYTTGRGTVTEGHVACVCGKYDCYMQLKSRTSYVEHVVGELNTHGAIIFSK